MHKREIVHLNRKTELGFGYAQAVRVGDRVVVAGMAALDRQLQVRYPNDLPRQLEIVYSQLTEVLNRFGLRFAHVVKETIFTTDMDGFLKENERRKAFFEPGHLPATTAIAVSGFVLPGLMLEVELDASALVDVASPQSEIWSDHHDG